jgi:hypothetical protein
MCTGVVFLGAIAVTSLAIAYRCSKKWKKYFCYTIVSKCNF